MGSMYRVKRKIQKKLEAYHRKNTKPNKEALWVFGMQKAGTSAIASLLAHRTGKTATIDTPLLWNPYYNQLRNNKLSFCKHITKNSYDFSKEIIKEPAASVIIDQIDEYFDLDKFIFIYRNPYDVIRSILNRLGLPGDKENIDLNLVNKNWRVHFNDGENYVESLIKLWIEVYSQNMYIENQRCIFVKYEDFVLGKQVFIDSLCDKLGYQKIHDIEYLLDHNFQPKGEPNVNLIHFFGESNYDLIEQKTKPYQR
jgi:hypothetical protein